MPALLLFFCLIFTGNYYRDGYPNHPPAASRPDAASINRLLDQVDASDEPTLRVFIRLKIASYLWSNPSGSINPEAVAKAALADLQAHEKEIPALYVNLFRRDLTAQLMAHAPDPSASQTEGSQVARRSDVEVAYALLGQENGAEKAVGLVRRSIAAGQDPGPVIVPFLHRLEKVSAADVPTVLAAMMSEEESRPGYLSAEALFTLKHLYVREQTPPELQRRYFAALINRAGDTEADAALAVDTYAVLDDVLPVVERLSPELYPVAGARLSQLAWRVPDSALERLSAEKRVSQSRDPLAQLIAEADAAGDPSLKEALQVEAAHLALEKGQTRTAIDLVAHLEPKGNEARLWRDQFVEGAVGRAVAKGDVEVARYGADQIRSADIHSSALQKIALHLQKSNDPAGARDALDSALKLVNASDDGADKAGALLDLAASYAKVDSQRVPELTRAAVTAINKIPAATRKAGAGDAHLGEVENMMKVAYKLIPAFQTLGAADRDGAINSADGIQRPELRIAAKLGVYTAPPAADNSGQGVASN